MSVIKCVKKFFVKNWAEIYGLIFFFFCISLQEPNNRGFKLCSGFTLIYRKILRPVLNGQYDEKIISTAGRNRFFTRLFLDVCILNTQMALLQLEKKSMPVTPQSSLNLWILSVSNEMRKVLFKTRFKARSDKKFWINLRLL